MFSVEGRVEAANAWGFSKVDASNIDEYEAIAQRGCITGCGVSIIGALALGIGSALLMRHFSLAKKVVIPGAIAASMVGLASGCVACCMVGAKREIYR